MLQLRHWGRTLPHRQYMTPAVDELKHVLFASFWYFLHIILLNFCVCPLRSNPAPWYETELCCERYIQTSIRPSFFNMWREAWQYSADSSFKFKINSLTVILSGTI